MTIHDFDLMDRRLLLQRALVLVGSAAVLGGCATLPIADGTSTLFALTEPQRATLAALTDTIMPATDTPGALAVGVPAGIETMMRSWASADTRAKMLASLDRIETLGGGFAALSAAGRYDVLNPYDAEALTVLRPVGTTIRERLAGPERRDPGYTIIRELVLVLYYYSEVGLTDELEYAALPGRWDPSVALTPESRAKGGFGNF